MIIRMKSHRVDLSLPCIFLSKGPTQLFCNNVQLKQAVYCFRRRLDTEQRPGPCRCQFTDLGGMGLAQNPQASLLVPHPVSQFSSVYLM